MSPLWGTAAALLAAHGLAPSGFHSDFEAALARARQGGWPVFVHATAAWCEPCRGLERDLYPVPQVAEQLGRFVRVAVDVETPQGKDLWMRWRLSSLPTLLFFDPEGREATALRLTVCPSTADPAAFVAHLERALAELAPAHERWRAPVALPWAWVLGGAGLAVAASLWWWARRERRRDRAREE